MKYRRRTLGAVLPFLGLACNDSTGPQPESDVRPDAEQTGVPVVHPRGFEGYATRGDLRTGFIRLLDGAPREVTYEVHDGRAIWQGDIVLGLADAIPASLAEFEAAARSDAAQGFRLTNALLFWTAGVVPYVIHSNVPNPDRITNAIEIVERSTAGVDFVPRSGQDNYVRFIADDVAVGDGAVCLSSLGMIGGQQDIRLNDGCDGFSTAHEILHALGLRHEHNRCDRDTYIQINEFNIVPGYHSQFEKECDEGLPVGGYDMGSIMHYGPFAFALVPDIPTIVALVEDAGMGQRQGLSEGDSRTVNDMYGAFNEPPLANFSPFAGEDPLVFPEGTPIEFESKSADPDDDKLWYFWQIDDDPGCDEDPFGCTNETVTTVFRDDGEYEVKLTVFDSPIEISDLFGFHRDDKTSTITIDNVAPAVQAGADATIGEGSVFARSGSYTDPGVDDAPWTATVDYDDGNGEQPLQSSLVQGFMLERRYVDNRPGDAPFEIVVEVTDKDGGKGSDQVDVTVLNVAPNVFAGSDGTLESGAFLEFVGNFGDPGALDAPWSWEIEWSDGNPSSGTTNDQSSAISASHRFCGTGQFPIRLDVTDKDGETGSDSRLLQVVSRIAEIVIRPGDDVTPLNLRSGGLLPVAILSTPDLAATDVDPSSVMLGDGVAPETPVAHRNNGLYQAAVEDVNSDGLLDLVMGFDIRTLVAREQLSGPTTTLRIEASLNDACTSIEGEGTLVIRP